MAAGKKLTKKNGDDISPVSQDTIEPEGMNLPSLVQRIADIHYHLVERATKAVNVSLTLRNWLIGHSLQNYELEGKDRAAYGDRLFSKLAKDLTSRGVSNCSRRQLYYYRDFYLAYPHIVGSLHPQLPDRLKRKETIPENEKGTRGTYKKTGCGESPSAQVEASRYLKHWSEPGGFLDPEGKSSQRKYLLKRS